MEDFRPLVTSIIRSVLRDRYKSDLEDVVQDTLIKVYLHQDQLIDDKYKSTWVGRIAINTAITFLRARRSRGDKVTDSGDDVLKLIESTLKIPSGLDRDLIARMLSKIGKDDRQILILRYMEGYTIEEVSTLLNMRTNTVKTRTLRALDRMRQSEERLKKRSVIITL